MKFITVPLKKAEPTDWVHPLKAFLSQIYGSFSNYEDSVRKFDKLRTDIVHSDKDDIAKNLLYRYYGQLELLELRVPMDLLKIEFTWHDAFKPSKKISQHSVAFEKASVLFNLAALLSQLGADSSKDDLKAAYSAFQKAAGIFSYIKENFMHAPSDDMSVDAVAAFSKLMLAQAQEAFLLKYLDSGATLKDSLCSKLAQSAANLYGGVRELTIRIEFFPSEQDDYCKIKQLYYESLAYYYNSKVESDNEEYGNALANLKAAEDKLSSYGAFDPSFDYEIVELLKEHTDTVKADYKQLDKDNDFIYHQNVPAVASISTIKPLNASKEIPLNEQKVDEMVGHDLFENIIPMSVHEKSSLYSEQKAQILRDEDDRCATAKEEFTSALEFLKIPESLTELQKICDRSRSEQWSNSVDNGDSESDDVDPRILAISSEISGSSISLKGANRLRVDVDDTLKRCEQLLRDDDVRFTGLRSQYGSQFTQEQYPSEIMQLKQELEKAKKSLKDAGDSDKKISMLREHYQTEIDELSLGPTNPKFLALLSGKGGKSQEEQLSQQISLLDLDDGAEMDLGEAKKKVEAMNSKLQDLRRLQKERDNTLADLKKAVRDDDISNVLVLNKDKDDLEGVFNEELQKFNPYQERISTTIDKQTSLINSIKQLMASVLDDKAVKSAMKEYEKKSTTRQAKTAAYLAAYDSWKAYSQGCEQAAPFYKQLFKFAEELKFKIEKYVGQRANEGNRFVQSIQARSSTEEQLLRQSMNQYSFSSQNAASPRGSFGRASSSSSTSSYRRPAVAMHAPPSQAPYSSSQRSRPPPLPSKPGSNTNFGSANPGSTNPGSTNPGSTNPGSSINSAQNTDFYSTPSAYNPSLYSKFGNQSWKQ